MEYVKLDGLENQYPSVESYDGINNNTSVLYGLYPNKNKIEFVKPTIENITPVSKTSFRFIISIKNGNESAPKLFTSETYYNDLKDSLDNHNPYFLNKSLDEKFIVKIDISKILQVASTLSKNELRDGAFVTKNVFLKQDVKIVTNEKEIKEQKETYDIFLKKRDELRNDVILKEKNFNKIPSFNFKKKKQAKSILNAAENSLKLAEADFQKAIAVVGNNSTKTATLEDTKLSPDYIELIQYFDWVLTSEDFTPDSADSGGVKVASEIGSWKVNIYNPAAFSEIDTSQYKDPEEAATDENKEKDGTKVGNFIRKIEKIPVIGTIVTGVKAVVNVVGKAVKAVGGFIKKIFSDKRTKTNIVKVATIGDINIYKFNYIWDIDTQQYGVIAQELLGTKYESVVFVDEETGLYKVDYEKLNEMVEIIPFINQLENSFN